MRKLLDAVKALIEDAVPDEDFIDGEVYYCVDGGVFDALVEVYNNTQLPNNADLAWLVRAFNGRETEYDKLLYE